MNAFQLLTAIRRIPAGVLAHQVRRKCRDTFAALAPGLYQARITHAQRRMPPITATMRMSADIARFIGRYYRSSPQECWDAARGCFHIMGSTVDFGAIDRIDWRHRLEDEHDHNLWRMKLCQLEVVHSLLAEGRAEDRSTIIALLESFERALGFGLEAPFRTVWSPYGASHRILAIASGLAIAKERGTVDPDLEAMLHRFLHRDATFVRANVEHDLRNNHTERNLAALCLYSMISAPLSRQQVARLDREVMAIIEQTMLPDGMQIERSAMYQGLSVMALRIFGSTDILSVGTRARAVERGAAAEFAWQMMSHRDGDIALFNDSWAGETPQARDVLGRSEADWDHAALPDAGYYRMRSGEIDVWMDAGEIGPDWNPGHGHADFLAIEVDISSERFIVDPGTSQYSTGPRRAFERSNTSHNGPAFSDFEPVEYFGCFKVGRLAAPDPSPDVCPEHTLGGSLTTARGAVRRSVMSPTSGTLVITDTWMFDAPGGQSRFLVPADWELVEGRHGEIRFSKGKVRLRLDASNGHLVYTGSDTWCRHYMKPEAAHVLTLLPHRAPTLACATLRITQLTAPEPTAAQENVFALPLGDER